MPAYEVVSPSGKKYRVDAPEGATLEDAIEYVAEELEPSLMSDASPGPTTSVTEPDETVLAKPEEEKPEEEKPEKEETEKRQGIFESEQLQFLNPIVAPVDRS